MADEDEDFTDPFGEHPLKKPFRDLRKFPYNDLYRVRNMLFTMEIPVFTALPEDADKEIYKFSAVICFN